MSDRFSMRNRPLAEKRYSLAGLIPGLVAAVALLLERSL